jgi:hypothetical protein
MKAAEKGFYVDLLVMMHDRGGPVSSDIAIISRATSTTPASAKNYLETLLVRGLVYRIGPNELWSPVSKREMENQEERSDIARKKSSKRWDNSEENQRSVDAAAYRYENRDIDRDPEGLFDPQGSTKSHSDKEHQSINRKEAAREGAAYTVDDPIPIDGVGTGRVEFIISRRPLTLIAIHEDEYGTRSHFRMKQQRDQSFSRESVSRHTAEKLITKAEERDRAARLS